MLLPESCSVKVDRVKCRLPPSHVVSVQSKDGEYMLAVVCDDHMVGLEGRLRVLQKEGKMPLGNILLQPIRAVGTDCVTGNEEDYVEIELKRGFDSERKA